jgi:hypothetical protein
LVSESSVSVVRSSIAVGSFAFGFIQLMQAGRFDKDSPRDGGLREV